MTLHPASTGQPLFYFNYSTSPETCPWQHVATEVWPPCVLPQEDVMQLGGGLVFHILDQEPEHIVKAALRTGLDLTVKQIDQIISANSVALPSKGSGASGNLIKRDKVTALVHFFFSDCSEAYQNELIDRMSTTKKKQQIAKSALMKFLIWCNTSTGKTPKSLSMLRRWQVT